MKTKLAMVLMLGMCGLVGCAARGTKPLSVVGDPMQMTYWHTTSGRYCGTVSLSTTYGYGPWEAQVMWWPYDGSSGWTHYFATQEEATKWLTTNWCKP